MGAKSLSPAERKVLNAVQFDSRQSVARVASKLRMKTHSVVYALKQMTERGVIRPYILTNPHALGLTDYCIFFNYIGEEKRARQKIIEYCKKSQQVAYFAELSGPHQFSVSLFCGSIFEVSEFFSRLGNVLPKSSFDRSFALRLRFTQFLSKWHPAGGAVRTLDRTRTTEIVDIDEVDRRILGYYSQNAAQPLSRVAAFAGVSESTVRNRLQRMEQTGVIHSFAYIVDSQRAGISTYRVILTAKGLDNRFSSRLYEYAMLHPRCGAFVHCAGAWDFEINFDLEEPSELGSMLEEITDHFGSNIRTMHTVSELTVHRAHHFPLDAGKVA